MVKKKHPFNLEEYIAGARHRAKRRKSPWNLFLFLLVFASWPVLTYGLFRMIWHVHTIWYPAHTNRLGEFWTEGIGTGALISSFLFLIPLLIAAIPLSMILANCLVWIISPLRKVFDHEAKGIEGASFFDATVDLVKLAAVMVPICLLLSLIGAGTLRSLR